MDPGELQSHIIALCKEHKLISYEQLCSLTGCDSEQVRKVCDGLLKENLVEDVDNFWIKATESLLAILPAEKKSPSPEKPPAIFLSYARDDDEPFVKRLYEDLTQNGLMIWWDRVSMPNRQLTFHQEIRDAINAHDRLLLVIGPKSVTSDYLNQEWQWALKMGKCINLVVRLDGSDGKKTIDGYELIPEELKLIHAEDFRDDTRYVDHLQNLVRQLKDPAPPLGKLVAVPTLPVHYRPQPDRLRQLRDLLLADLQRPVGIGKSVLASALARDPEVRRAFPDGIFWIPIGQDPNLAELLRQTVKDLGGDPDFDDIHTGKTRLKEIIADRSALLILDDVWKAADADVFDVATLRSRLLLTTRDAGLVTSCTGTSYQVQLPSLAEAEILLATAGGVSVDALPGAATDIIKECDRLPLALTLCGGMAAKGQSWERILQMLKEARPELIADRHEIDESHQSLWRAMDVSVSVLSSEEQQRFAELAVFCFEKSFPEEAVITLWNHTGGLDDSAAADLLMSFYERSLVLIDRSPGPDGKETVTVSLHDLLFEYATRSAEETCGSMDRLHTQLLKAYAKNSPDFVSGPDDGYFLQHLTSHLIAAGNRKEAEGLLLDPRWLRRKIDLGMIQGLIEEYEPLSENNRPLFLIQGALRLSSHILSRDPTQFATQMFGRLLGFEEQVITEFLDQVAKEQKGPWLRPLHPSFEAPGGALLRTLDGYTGWVTSVAISPDGRTALSGSFDNIVLVWDIWSGETLRVLKGHRYTGGGWVTSVAIGPDGRTAISGSWDNTIRVWDIWSGETLRVLEGHTDAVTSVAISLDGRTAISGSFDGTVRVWDIQSGETLLVLEGHTQGVNSVAISPDGRTAISLTWGESVMVWEIRSGESLQVLKGHTRPVRSVAISPDDLTALCGSRDNTMRAWDMVSGEPLRILGRHTDSVSSVAISPDGRTALSVSDDHTVRVWDIDIRFGESLQVLKGLQILKGHTDWVLSVAISPDGRTALSGSHDETVRVWDIRSGETLRVLEGHTDSVSSVAISLDGRTALSGSRDNTIRAWDIRSGETLRVLEGHTDPVISVAISPDGRTALSVSDDYTVRVWDIRSDETIRTLYGHLSSVISVAISPDGHTALSGSFFDETVRVWDTGSGETTRVLKGHTGSVESVAISPDGRTALSGSHDTTVRVWDIGSGETLQVLEGHTGSVKSVTISPDGRTALSGSFDETVRVWDIGSGETTRVLKGHTGPVTSVTISPDGRTALSGSLDNTVRVWDMVSGETLRVLKGHTGQVISVAISPDGHTALSCSSSGDTTIKVWDIRSGETIRVLNWHTGPAKSIAISPDGHTALSCSGGSIVSVWDIRTGTLLFQIQGNAVIRSVAMTSSLVVFGEGGVLENGGGRVLFLSLENIPIEIPVLTDKEIGGRLSARSPPCYSGVHAWHQSVW